MAKLIRDQDRPIYRLPKQYGASVEIGRPTEKAGGRVWPHARSEKWDGECWLTVEAKGSEPRPGRPERLLQSGEALEIDCQRTKGRKTVGETHRIKTGSLKWEVIYDSANDLPDNFAVFDISNSPGLTFHYQPQLTAEEIAEGCVRPDNVVGSYAVYWSQSGRILRADGTERVNYETGKYCHIYRPEWVAANGERLLGEQVIVDSELRIAIPLAWIQSLGSAAWPLVLDPTIGYSSEPLSAVNLTNVSRANKGPSLIVTASAGDTLTQFSGWHYPIDIDRTLYFAAYKVESGAPTDRLAAAVTVVSSAGSGKLKRDTAVVSQAMSDDVSYCVAMGATDGTSQFWYDAGETGDAIRGTDATLPDPWVGTTNETRKYGIYATYTEAATSKGRVIGGGIL